MTEATATAPAQVTEEISVTPVAVAGPAEFENLLKSCPRYTEIKTMPQQELRDLAANDWRNDTPACLNTLASIMSAAVTVAELIVQSAPYIQIVKDMMKLNAKLAAEGKPHKTFKSEGINVPPGTVVSNHGEDKPVHEDDPIGWLNTCPVVFRCTARHVNNLLNGKLRAALPALQCEEEDQTGPPPSQRNIRHVNHIEGNGDSVTEQELHFEGETPAPKPAAKREEPKPVMIPVPELKTGDVDALVNFLAADSLTGVLPPLDAVFEGLEDFNLAKQVEALARKIAEKYCTKKSTIKVKVSYVKKQQKDEPPVTEELPPFTEGDE